MDDATRQAIEEVAALDFFASESEDIRNSVRILLASMYIGTNADKIAKALGLNRDKFVRPRAQRLRANGVWADDGKVTVLWDPEKDDEVLTGLLLDAMVAEGQLVRAPVPHPDTPGTTPPGDSGSPPPSPESDS